MAEMNANLLGEIKLTAYEFIMHKLNAKLDPFYKVDYQRLARRAIG